MPVAPDYPAIAATTIEGFAIEFENLEQSGRIDSKGGSEWRGTLTRWLLEQLDEADDTMTRRQLIRDAVWHAQEVGSS